MEPGICIGYTIESMEVPQLIQTQAGAGQLVYEADASLMQSVQKCRERVHHVCRRYMNHRVRIRTAAGQQVEGIIVGVDDHYVYLDTSGNAAMMRPPYPPYYGPYNPYYNPYYSTVLPLALFDLLVISLLV